MTRLERSLELLRTLNFRRLRFSGWAGEELVRRASDELAAWDEECRLAGQLSLLRYVPTPVPEKPSACEECGCFSPTDFATAREGNVVWLCVRCRDGRLSDDQRRQLNIYDRISRATRSNPILGPVSLRKTLGT